MNFSSYNKFQILEYLRPHTDNADLISESPNAYCIRFQKHYSQFPEEVILQWFYDHPDSLDQNEWLDYNHLSFELVKLPLETITSNCFIQNPFVEQYYKYFLSGKSTPRINRISGYIEDNGSWPVPPIVLDNFHSKHIFPWGLECSSPYHLLEGHHRFSALLALLKNARRLKENHDVWLCKRELS
jgi:hypothetical protein